MSAPIEDLRCQMFCGIADGCKETGTWFQSARKQHKCTTPVNLQVNITVGQSVGTIIVPTDWQSFYRSHGSYLCVLQGKWETGIISMFFVFLYVVTNELVLYFCPPKLQTV